MLKEEGGLVTTLMELPSDEVASALVAQGFSVDTNHEANARTLALALV